LDNRVFRYSLSWRIAFAVTVPLTEGLALFCLSNSSSDLHFNLAIVLSALSFIPYFFLILKFSEKYITDDVELMQCNTFVRRTLKWKDIIEYRDFFNVIVLMPILVKKSIHIYFYRNIKDYIGLRKYFTNKSLKYEVNMMSRKRDRIFLIIDIGTTAILCLIITAIIAVSVLHRFPFFDSGVLLTGIISGMFFVLCSVAIWMLLNDLTIIAREYTHVMATIMSITFMVPMLITASPALEKSGFSFAIFLFTYLLGYVMGWGGMSAFFPNREPKKKIKVLNEGINSKK
jgi:hypothetical protein